MNRAKMYFIICNEFCERFCYYGFRSLLFTFTKNEYSFSTKQATLTLHLFIALSYMFTLPGGVISDMLLGKYKTIVYLSAVYFTGTTLLTYSSISLASPRLALLGLFLATLGTGGIKPCVAAFGGDQFPSQNPAELSAFFSFFYFAINIGSMLSMVLVPILSEIPCLERPSCYPLAFGTSSLLLGFSVVLFVMGTSWYVIRPPKKENLLNLVGLLIKRLMRQSGDAWGSRAPEQNAAAAGELENSMRALVFILRLFGPVTFFWMLYDQQSSSWIEQGLKMDTKVFLLNKKIEIASSQMQALNSILVLLFIPLFSKVIYPNLEAIGIRLSPIGKMAGGIILASLSFLCSALLEHLIVGASLRDERIFIMWQLPQYVLLTAGEIMLNMTGLEFAYSEAPENMKSVILSAWLLATAVGNLFVIALSSLDIMALFPSYDRETWNFVLYALLGLLASRYMLRLNKAHCPAAP
jgi:dipeptide/tripeptide permease